SGDRRTAHNLAVANHYAFSGERFDGIITACASCASFLREQYPRLAGADSPLANTLTLQEFLTERRSSLPLKHDPNLKITWHQPCHLSRHLSVELAEPLLKQIGNYIEMEEKEVCCGGAGSYFAKFPDTSAAIGERKARNIIASGADVVATACPACAMQLSASLARLKADVRVVLLGDLLVD
ncbi:(Fe-S)-binding protein, partial [bacterium]|nr:(Fe-S)-binding protein [bacterium]